MKFHPFFLSFLVCFFSASYAHAVHCQLTLKKMAETRKNQAYQARLLFKEQQEKLPLGFKFEFPMDRAVFTKLYTHILGKAVSYDGMDKHVEDLNRAFDIFVSDPSRENWTKVYGAFDTFNMKNEWYGRQRAKQDKEVDAWNAATLFVSEKAYEAFLELTERYCR